MSDSFDSTTKPSAAVISQVRSGTRHGQTKEAITRLVQELPRGTHLTAPEVYRHAKELGIEVSLSSVYRTLHSLQAYGNVTALGSDRGRRYEALASGHDHDHLICLKCGLTIEFVDDLIRGFGKSVAQRKGYEHKSSRFDILGLCGECKAKDEDHRIQRSVECLEVAVAAAEESIQLFHQAISHYESRKTARAQDNVRLASGQLNEALSQCAELLLPFDGPDAL